LRECLGQGSVGTVYKAFEPALDRVVAIKVLHEELARDEGFVARFQRENAAAARVVHPHVVPIHYIGVDGGRHFVVMRFVAGDTLAKVLKRGGQWPVDEAISLLEQMVSGLAAAHRRRLLHRHLTPQNVILELPLNRPLLTDFSLSGLSVRGNERTHPEWAEFLAPERALGHAVDARSDLYSVGAIAWRMLTGETPFGEMYAGVDDRTQTNITLHELTALAPSVPAALAAVVVRLLSSSPEERPATADELLVELRDVRKASSLTRRESIDEVAPDETSLASSSLDSPSRQLTAIAPPFQDQALAEVEPAPAKTGVWSDERRRPFRWLMMVAVVSVVAMIALEYGPGRRTAAPLPDTPNSEPPSISVSADPDPDPDPFLIATDTQRGAAFSSSADGLRIAGIHGEPAGSRFLVFKQNGKVEECDPQTGRVEVRITPRNGNASRLVLSSQAVIAAPANNAGAGQATLWHDGDLFAGRLDGSRMTLENDAEPWAVADSVDGSVMLAAQSKTISVLRMSKDLSSIAERNDIVAGELTLGALHPSGQWAAAGLTSGELVVAPGNRQRQAEAKTFVVPATALTFHRQRPLLAIGTSRAEVFLYDCEQQKWSARLTCGEGEVRSIAIDTSGRALAVASDDTVRVFDLSLGFVRILLNVPGVCAVEFSDRGETLAVGDKEGRLRTFDTSFPYLEPSQKRLMLPEKSELGDLLLRFNKEPAPPRGRAVTTDGRLEVVAMPKEVVRLVEAQTNKTLHSFDNQVKASGVAIAPNNRWVATAWENDVRLWDILSGRQIRRMEGDLRDAQSVCFSADGRRLAASCVGTLSLWETDTGRLLREYRISQNVEMKCLFFNANERWLIAASRWTSSSLYWASDVESGQILLRWVGPAQVALLPRRLLLDPRFGSVELAEEVMDDRFPESR
jgi:serine/threonine protein kinase/WD40 repeat protein